MTCAPCSLLTRAVRRLAFQTARSAFMEALNGSELAGISSTVARARVLEGPQERSVEGLSGRKGLGFGFRV